MANRGALYNATILLIVLYPLSLRAVDPLLLSHVIYNIEYMVILFVGVDIARILGQSKRIDVISSYLL